MTPSHSTLVLDDSPRGEMTPQGVSEPLGAIDSPSTTAQFQLPVYRLSQVLITQNNMKATYNNVH